MFLTKINTIMTHLGHNNPKWSINLCSKSDNDKFNNINNVFQKTVS